MKELTIINQQLPVVEFNFEEIKESLRESMIQYSNLVVTDETLSMCKQQQKDLAGIRTKIETYRKDTKKEMEKPIKDFEDKCKQLVSLVEEAEKPLKEGIQVFDDKKREEKRQIAEKLIAGILIEKNLMQKYAVQLTVLDKYTNLTAKTKDVAADIEQRALVLLEQQNRELEMLEIIKDAIENANKMINAKISLEDFQRLINQGTPTKEILSEINSRAERIKKSEIAAEELRIKKEQEKARLAELEKERLPEPLELVAESKQETTQETSTTPPALEKVEKVSEDYFVVEIKITETRANMTKIGDFLKSNGFNYKLISQTKVN